MLHSVVKPATVLLALGLLGWTAESAQAQIGYGYSGHGYYSPTYGGYNYGYGSAYGPAYGGYGGYGAVGYGQSDEDFVHSLYVNLLGREPEPYEVLPWVRNMRLLGLSRNDVAWAFRNSREYLGKYGYGGAGGRWDVGYRPYGYQGGYGW